MRNGFVVYVLLVLVCLSAVACSRSGSSTLAEPGLSTGDEPAGMAVLGGLDNLPAPNHEVTTTGPDWFELELFSDLASSGVVTPHAIDELPLVALTSPAYAIFGVYGFDGDNGPTSARVTGTSISGEYFVGFSDYVDGTWAFSGPFTAGATAEIPLDEDHLSENAFTNENGHCFIAVVVAPGGSLTLTHLELGLHGGTDGPEAPFLMGASSNPDGIQLNWFHSEDLLDPDFAGYRIERAPLFSGDFTGINAQPTREDHFVDDTAVVGEVYRYRVWAVDTAGNGNVSITITYEIDPLGLMTPVVVLDLPHGPLYGPISLPIDLSGSYDPEGQPIDAYMVDVLGGSGSYSGADPAPVLDLQPGNYRIRCVVQCGPRIGTTYGYLNIYPKWNEPVVASPAVPTYFHGLWLSAGILPSTGRVAVGTTDLVTDQFTVTTEGGDGELQYSRMWVGDNSHCPQAPVVMGDNLVYLVQSSGQLRAVNYNGTGLDSLFTTAPYAQNVASLTGDGSNRMFLVVCLDMGGTYDLMVIPTGTGTANYKPAVNVGQINWIHAVYNPGIDALDIVYNLDTTNEMYWVRDDFSGVPVAPVEIVPGASTTTPVMALNPANDRPMVAYMDNADHYVKFTALTSDLATWTAPETIDDSDTNLSIHSLVFADGYPVAGIGLAGGTYNVYRRGAGWLKTNTLPDSHTVLSLGTVIDAPEPNGVRVAYSDTLLSLNSYECNFDGTNTLDWSLPGITPNGMELHAAAGSDGLHAVYFSAPSGMGHLVSPDGAVWTAQTGLPSAANIDLTATADGEVYVSYFALPSMQLDYWDGAAWNNVASIPTDSGYQAILGYDENDLRIRFACYNTTLSLMSYQSCLQGTPSAVANIDHGQPVWGGIVNHYGNTVMIAKGATATGSVINLATWATANEEPMVAGGTSLMFLDDYFTRGKTMGYCHHNAMTLAGETYSYLFTSNLTGEALRVDRVAFLPEAIVYIDDLQVTGIAGQRRTVTALQTASGSAVVLFNEMDFDNQYFAWSNFGDWETLPLPRGVEHMMNPELVCGMDGRWHLLYRDWVTDDLMCVSTE